MNQQWPSTTSFRQTPGVLANGGARYGPPVNLPQPPPLPPRRMLNQTYNNYRPSYMGGYSGIGGGYGYNSFGLGSMGGGYNYSPYGSNYRQFGGASGDVENRFVQFAEESSRPAFQSIESIVHTFSSITMMLESTFFAMSSSFRAILSVAENVGRVRSLFGQLLSTFALIRFTKWLYRWIFFKLGLRSDDPNTDALWRKAVLDTVNGKTNGPTTWPILVFLSLLLAIPYLVHKLTRNLGEAKVDEKDPQEWFKLNEPVYSATAAYDFVAATPEEISLKAGQKIWLAPQSLQSKNLQGWSTATDSVNVGLVPSNYITIVGEIKRKTESNGVPQLPKDTTTHMEESFELNENENNPQSVETPNES